MKEAEALSQEDSRLRNEKMDAEKAMALIKHDLKEVGKK